ncbi:uncharacterized protein METZ01_LOCUS501449, partial [marine metagenome]
MSGDLIGQGIENVQIISIGKGQFSDDNSNWTDDNNIPVVIDPQPNDIWNNWGASQRDLFFLDTNGNYVTHFNITTWNYDAIYNTILELLPSVNGCVDDVNGAFAADGGCETVINNFGIACSASFMGVSVADECPATCNNCPGVCGSGVCEWDEIYMT